MVAGQDAGVVVSPHIYTSAPNPTSEFAAKAFLARRTTAAVAPVSEVERREPRKRFKIKSKGKKEGEEGQCEEVEEGEEIEEGEECEEGEEGEEGEKGKEGGAGRDRVGIAAVGCAVLIGGAGSLMGPWA